MFKVLINSKITKNYILLKIVKKLKISYKLIFFISISYNFRKSNIL